MFRSTPASPLFRVAWTDPRYHNGWLALPKNGRVEALSELFGNFTPQPPSRDPNGYLALRVYDVNRDGVIDAADPVYPLLRVWIDANHNGIAEPEELHTLKELGRLSPGGSCNPTTTYYQNHDHGIYIDASGATETGVVVKNNKFYNIGHGWPVQFYSSSGGTQVHRLLRAGERFHLALRMDDTHPHAVELRLHEPFRLAQQVVAFGFRAFAEQHVAGQPGDVPRAVACSDGNGLGLLRLLDLHWRGVRAGAIALRPPLVHGPVVNRLSLDQRYRALLTFRSHAGSSGRALHSRWIA